MDPFLETSPLPADAPAGPFASGIALYLPGQDLGGTPPDPAALESITRPHVSPVAYQSSGYMNPAARVALQFAGGILLAIGVIQLFALIAGVAWMLVNAEDTFFGKNLQKLASMSDEVIATNAVFLMLGMFVTFVILVLMIIDGVSMLLLRGRPWHS